MTPIETLEKIAATRGHVVEITNVNPTSIDRLPVTSAALPWRVTVWRNPTAGRVYRAASQNGAVAAALNDYRKSRSIGNREEV